MPHDHHPPVRTLHEYRCGRLAPPEMLVVSDHLAACPECRNALSVTDHGPTYEELADAADGVLDPAAYANLTARLAEFPAAAAEWTALQQFKQEMAPQAGRVYGPSEQTAGSVAVPAKIVAVPEGFWHMRRFPALAAAAAVALLIGGWWIRASSRPTADGARLLTARDGQRVELATLPMDLREAVEQTLREGHPVGAAPTTIDALRPASIRLAGPVTQRAGEFRVVAPVGFVVQDMRPTLRWVAMPDASAYIVTLARPDGTDARVSSELPGTQTTWVPPEPLTSGAVYVWQVEALRGGETLAKAPAPPVPEARFRVLPDTLRAELARIETQFGRFPLVMAVAYARVGLEEEAAGQWAKLEQENPGSVLAKRLRQEAQSPSPIKTNGAQ